MKKTLILLGFLSLALPGMRQSWAQCSSMGCGTTPGYYWDLGAYTYFLQNATTATKAAYGIDMGFNALFSSLNMINQGKAMEQEINARRNNLENQKLVERYHTEGIPPFAAQGPDGKPRSPKITWQDVQSIH